MWNTKKITGKYGTKAQRRESLSRCLKNTSDKGPLYSKSYGKAMSYFDKFSEIPFEDCMVWYNSDSDIWDAWLWIGEKLHFTIIWDDDPKVIMSVYNGNELILSQMYEDIDEVVGKWKNVMKKIEISRNDAEEREANGVLNRIVTKIRNAFIGTGNKRRLNKLLYAVTDDDSQKIDGPELYRAHKDILDSLSEFRFEKCTLSYDEEGDIWRFGIVNGEDPVLSYIISGYSLDGIFNLYCNRTLLLSDVWPMDKVRDYWNRNANKKNNRKRLNK